MRVIKLRAFYKGKMVYQSNKTPMWVGDVITDTKYYKAQFFTGKEDCEGVEIYQGDIIEFDEEEWGDLHNIFVVEWDDKNAAWCFGGGSTSEMEFRTVIGNIYENPELIPKT